MRLRPATRAALFVDSCLALPPLVQRNDAWPGSTHKERRICQSSLPAAILRSQNLQLCGGQRSVSCSVSGMGEEAATPGQPVRAFARACPECPRRFTLENRRLPLDPPQSSGKIRNSHVCVAHTLGQFVAGRNWKRSLSCAEAVEDATSLWKAEEN
jgi:hypothetical protein